MENLARPTPLSSGVLTHEIGRIVDEGDEGVFVVGTTTDRLAARRALSCLVTPRAGDLVALMRSTTGASYVVAVLERSSPASIELSAPGNVEMVTASGSVTLRGRDGVRLTSPSDVSIVSQKMNVHAVDTTMTTERLSFLGTMVTAQMDRVKVVAQTLDTMFERACAKVARSYRFVTEYDQLRAERIDYVAEQNLTLRAENAIVTAQDVVKMDGDQVHIG